MTNFAQNLNILKVAKITPVISFWL